MNKTRILLGMEMMYTNILNAATNKTLFYYVFP